MPLHQHIHSPPLSPLPSSSMTSASKTSAEIRTLQYACIITTFFFIIELLGGYLAHSLAIMSDAAHLLSDLAGFVISLLAVSMATLPPNATMSFGFVRAEVLGAFVSILFIWALTAVLVVFAVYRLFHPTEVDGGLMLLLGIIGLVVNIVLGAVLGHGHHGHSHHGHSHHGHSHGHSHSHSDSHDHLEPLLGADDLESQTYQAIESHPHAQHANCLGHTHDHDQDDDDDHDHHRSHADTGRETNREPRWHLVLFGNDIQSVNVRAAYLHVLGDALQSVGVIIAAIVIYFNPTWTFIDPLCTLVFAIIVIMTTMDLAKETLNILMEGTPPNVDLDVVHDRLLEIDQVVHVGDLHAWCLTPRRSALSVHLYSRNGADGHEISVKARELLVKSFGIFHVTIQVNCDFSGCCNDHLTFGNGEAETKCIPYIQHNDNTVLNVRIM